VVVPLEPASPRRRIAHDQLLPLEAHAVQLASMPPACG
jgi:hypothetical protein